MEKSICIVLCIAAATAVLLVTGCATTRGGSDSLVLAHQREISRLEAAVRGYDAAVGRAVERLSTIKDRADGMAGTVEELVTLFDEYQRAVDGLIRDYNELRKNIKINEQAGIDAVNSAAIDTDY